MSFQGGIEVSSYAGTKHGIVGLTKAFANEWAEHGICVNAIAPGYVATDLIEALLQDEKRNEAILGRIPAGRYGDTKDFWGVAVYLASNASDYCNGSVITVDGGWVGR
jgi:2-deoxy-D-gluconate 3-dehydrogenase